MRRGIFFWCGTYSIAHRYQAETILYKMLAKYVQSDRDEKDFVFSISSYVMPNVIFIFR
jgi:hypothetical protein